MMTQTLAIPRFSARGATFSRHRWLIAMAAILGGAAVILGVMLPWFSFFAGLKVVPGIAGSNGKLLLASGAATTATGLWFLLRGSKAARTAVSVMGVVLLASTSWLLIRLFAAHRELMAGNAMMVPRIEAGLFVCFAGAAMVAATILLRQKRTGSE